MIISFPFRSFHNYKLNWQAYLFLLIPVFYNVLILKTLVYITQFWSVFSEYYLDKLGLEATIIHSKYTLFNTSFLLPAINLEANYPNITVWWANIFIILSLYIASFFIADSFTPLKYFLRVFLIILSITQFYMTLYPTGFSYTIFLYTKSGFMQILAVLIATPWIFLTSYYLLGGRFFQKFIYTFFALAYFIALAPFQYLLNAWLIHAYSLVLMPVLFLYAGLMLNLLAVVSFCGYGISKEPLYAKFRFRTRT